MLKDIWLIIVCNLLMYIIIFFIFKIVYKKEYKIFGYEIDNNKVRELNKRVKYLEKKVFIQDILNQCSMEDAINEKVFYINKIIERYKKDQIGYLYRASIYLEFKKYDEAIEDFDRTLQINSNNKEAYRGKGVCLARKGCYYEAIQNYKKAIEIDKDYEVVYYNMGICYSRLKEYSKAIKSYTKALDLDQTDISAYYNRGRNYNRMTRYE